MDCGDGKVSDDVVTQRNVSETVSCKDTDSQISSGVECEEPWVTTTEDPHSPTDYSCYNGSGFEELDALSTPDKHGDSFHIETSFDTNESDVQVPKKDQVFPTTKTTSSASNGEAELDHNAVANPSLPVVKVTPGSVVTTTDMADSLCKETWCAPPQGDPSSGASPVLPAVDGPVDVATVDVATVALLVPKSETSLGIAAANAYSYKDNKKDNSAMVPDQENCPDWTEKINGTSASDGEAEDKQDAVEDPRLAVIHATPVRSDNKTDIFSAFLTPVQGHEPFQGDELHIALLVLQSATDLDAKLADFMALPPVATSTDQGLEAIDSPSDAEYVALVQRDFQLLEVSDVGRGRISSKTAISADQVVAGCDFHPPCVLGMSGRLIVAGVCFLPCNVSFPGSAFCGCRYGRSHHVKLGTKVLAPKGKDIQDEDIVLMAPLGLDLRLPGSTSWFLRGAPIYARLIVVTVPSLVPPDDVAHYKRLDQRNGHEAFVVVVLTTTYVVIRLITSAPFGISDNIRSDGLGLLLSVLDGNGAGYEPVRTPSFVHSSHGVPSDRVILRDDMLDCRTGHGDNVVGTPFGLIGGFMEGDAASGNAEKEPGVLSLPRNNLCRSTSGSVPGAAELGCAFCVTAFLASATVLETTFSPKKEISEGRAVVELEEGVWPPTVQASLTGTTMGTDMVCLAFVHISRYKVSE